MSWMIRCFSALGVSYFSYSLVYVVAMLWLDCDLKLAFYEIFGRSPKKLKGKVVFITGASSGIGEHTAIALAKYSVRLVCTGRRLHELERVKKACIAASKGKLTNNDVLVMQMDITDMNLHEENFNKALSHFGSIDILLNNAGRSQRAVWENIDMSVDREMFELNVFAVVNLTRIAIRYFNRKGSGHVAVTSSIAGVVGAPFSGTYTATKHAINGYYNSLRSEKIGTKLTVTVLCPGPTYTNFLAESFTEKKGEKFGIDARKTDRRMTGERCGKLCAVALANKLDECWMGLFPILPFTYVSVYFPTISKIFMKLAGPKLFSKLRDSKDNCLEQKKQ